MFSLDLLGITFSLSPRTLAAASLIALFAVLHICSLTAGKITQNALAMVLVGMVVVFVGRGFATGSGSWSHFHSSGAHFGTMNWLLALIPVMFTYSGWNAAAYVSEEIHASRRSMRPVLLGGTGIVIALYTVLNALYLYAIPAGQMRSATNVADAAAHALFGAGSQLVTPALIVALLGAISAMTIAGPRVYFAMARDGAFIPTFARTSRRFGTPALLLRCRRCGALHWSYLADSIRSSCTPALPSCSLPAQPSRACLWSSRREPTRSKPGETRPGSWFPAYSFSPAQRWSLTRFWKRHRIALIGVLLIAAGIPVYAAVPQEAAPPALALQPKKQRAIRTIMMCQRVIRFVSPLLLALAALASSVPLQVAHT